MPDLPFTFTIPQPDCIPSCFDNHLQRFLSSMQGQFLDTEAYEKQLAENDRLIYEVYEIKRPEIDGEMIQGISIVHPGKIGEEFFMTKGHFHTVLETAEVYYVLKGEGYMVMETPQGNAHTKVLTPGKVLYVPPCWAHRSVCTSRQSDLVTYFIYPAHAGHDYGTIEQQGFRKIILDSPEGIKIMDNPRWKKE